MVSCASESSSEMAKFALTQPVDAPVVNFDESVIGTYKTADTLLLLTLSHAFNLADKKIGIRTKESNGKLQVNAQSIINQFSGTLYAKIDSTSDELMARGKQSVKDFLMTQLDTLIRSVCHHPYFQCSDPKMINGSFFVHINLIDTLFKIDNKQVLKKMKNDFYLNFQDQSMMQWKVLKLSPKVGGIVISSMSDEDVYVLRRMIKMDKNSKAENEILNPDMQSFTKFVELKGFENQVELKKLN